MLTIDVRYPTLQKQYNKQLFRLENKTVSVKNGFTKQKE